MYEVSLNDAESLYVDIIYYLKNEYSPSHLDHTKKRALRLKAKQYQLINDIIFRKNYDFVLLRCLEKTEAEKSYRNYMMDQQEDTTLEMLLHIKSWVQDIISYFVQIPTQLREKISSLPNYCWKTKEVVHATTVGEHRKTIQSLGLGHNR